MRSYIDCVHCYLKQVVTCMSMAGVDEKLQYENLYILMDYIKAFNRYDSPAENSSKAILKTYELLDTDDPFREAKKHSNDLALQMYPELKSTVEKSPDRLYEALKISVAGNIIDLGINRDFDIEKALEYSLETGFSKDHYGKFLKKLEKTDEILFLGDNSGEIVFDRLLVEELSSMGKKVTYVVKEGPVLNDSTMEDAAYTGIDRVCRVITNGTNFLGTCLKLIPDEFRRILVMSELVIAKGQANFEGLEEWEYARDRIFFLLKIKCEEVAKCAGVNFGDVVFFAG